MAFICQKVFHSAHALKNEQGKNELLNYIDAGRRTETKRKVLQHMRCEIVEILIKQGPRIDMRIKIPVL